MLDKIRSIAASVREYNDEESGMEAAQTILILVFVVIIIVAVFGPLRTTLTNRGAAVNQQISGVT